jgi:cobalamin biosynthesis Mg chelatase CobN
MADWYYYNESGEKIGPVRGRELKKLVRQGIVTPKTKIEDNEGRTALAKHVTGLPFSEVKQSPSNTAENLSEQDFAKLREDIERLQQDQERTSGISLPASVSADTNPFTAAMPVAQNPFSTAPPPDAKPQRVSVPRTDKNRRTLWAAMTAAMRSTMDVFASMIGFILVLVLACVVVGVIWWVLEITDVLPTDILSRFSGK